MTLALVATVNQTDSTLRSLSTKDEIADANTCFHVLIALDKRGYRRLPNDRFHLPQDCSPAESACVRRRPVSRFKKERPNCSSAL